ncbi:MAG: PHP domain-containing protein [Chloroflexi bacterium]|nr:PHP domain-containing protein [Chloroflexota bacterium]
MFIDMHCHSVASDDARATVDQYLKWVTVLRSKGYRVDGIVLTEHRQFNREADYSEISAESGVVVLRGAELDTRHGHFLVYGVNDHLTRRFDFSDVRTDPFELMREARASGAIAIPAHPGRSGIGLCEYIAQGVEFPEVKTVELLNGGSRAGENERAAELVQARGYWGTGGSDAHFVSAVGRCLTRFPDHIRTEAELVQALYRGGFQPVRLEQTAQQPVEAKESR